MNTMNECAACKGTAFSDTGPLRKIDVGGRYMHACCAGEVGRGFRETVSMAEQAPDERKLKERELRS